MFGGDALTPWEAPAPPVRVHTVGAATLPLCRACAIIAAEHGLDHTTKGSAVYELTVEREFSAAHRMRGHPGACARLHGHNYRVLLTVEGEQLGDTGILVDFAELRRICDTILGELDHRDLNEIPPFDTINPSSENLARYLFSRAREALGEQARVSRVTVYESPTSSVSYREG